MPRYRISITSKDREAMLDLVRVHKFKVFDHGSQYSDATGYSVDGIAEPSMIARLQAAGYRVKQHEDVDKAGKERQGEVARGDRYRQKGPA